MGADLIARWEKRRFKSHGRGCHGVTLQLAVLSLDTGICNTRLENRLQQNRFSNCYVAANCCGTHYSPTPEQRLPRLQCWEVYSFSGVTRDFQLGNRGSSRNLGDPDRSRRINFFKFFHRVTLPFKFAFNSTNNEIDSYEIMIFHIRRLAAEFRRLRKTSSLPDRRPYLPVVHQKPTSNKYNTSSIMKLVRYAVRINFQLKHHLKKKKKKGVQIIHATHLFHGCETFDIVCRSIQQDNKIHGYQVLSYEHHGNEKRVRYPPSVTGARGENFQKKVLRNDTTRPVIGWNWLIAPARWVSFRSIRFLGDELL